MEAHPAAGEVDPAGEDGPDPHQTAQEGPWRHPLDILHGWGPEAAQGLLEAFRAPGGVLAGFRVPEIPAAVDEVGAYVDHFGRLLDSRIRMMIARRAGLPYSEVCARWSHDDLIAELAWDVMESADRWERCDRCGTKHSEVADDLGRPSDDSIWKLYLDTCVTCGELERAEAELAKVKVEPGTRWRLMPRQPGDPWRDDGGILADADPVDQAGSGADE